MNNRPISPPARRFALLAAAGCASISGACAAQTLRYNFESLVDPNISPVTNLAPGATQHGTVANPSKVSILAGEEILVNSVRYQLGKSLDLSFNIDNEESSAGHVDTGLNPSGWGMANNNTLNRNYTAMAWVKLANTTGDNIVFGQLNGNALHLGTRGGNLHSGHWGDDATGNVPAPTGVWQHIAWVNNGTEQSIYRNGVLEVGPTAGGASGGDGSNMVIGTFLNNGSFVGVIDEVKVFGDQVLTVAEIRTEMTNTLTPVPLAVVTSARLDNTGYTFTIKDFTPNSLVNPASVALEIDGFPVTVTSSTKTGDITTVTYQPTLPDLIAYGSRSQHFYTIRAKDQTNPAVHNIEGTGNLSMPVLPATLPGPAGTTSTWGVREWRSPDALTNIAVTVDGLGSLPAVDDDPNTNTIFDGTAPVMNHSDPLSPGSRGNFNNDLPLIGTSGATDNNIAFTGKTRLVIPAPGTYTFSVHSDDGFALRINGGPAGNTSRFVSSNRTGVDNKIDGSDPQTIFFANGSADSSTTGVYEFTAAGTYEVLMVSFDNTGGAFYELAWAPGSFAWDYQTTAWTLVGSPNDPTVTAVPFTERFPAAIPGTPGDADRWGVRTFYGVNTGDSTEATYNWLRDTGSTLTPDESNVFDRQRNILNMSDNRAADTDALQNMGHVGGDYPLPGSVGLGAASVTGVAHTAKGRISVTTAGVYTLNARGDDGFFLRIKAVSGTHPKFTRLSNPDPNNGNPMLEMSNLNVMWFVGGTGDSNTRGIITLAVGEYDIEYFNWQAGGGAWHELTAVAGEYPHGTEPPTGWIPLGYNYATPPAAQQPVISAAGWTVISSAPQSLLTGNIAGAEAALAAGGTSSTWDSVNFMDPQNAGGAASPVPPTTWPRNTASDDDNFAMKATAELVVPVAATYRLGYQGDDGGSLIIRGTGGNPNPSFETVLLENATGSGVVEAEDPVNDPSALNKVRTDVPTGNSRTIARITLQPGTYQLEGLFFEIAGGAYWGLIGASEPVVPTGNTTYFPLTKGGVVTGFSGLKLVAAVAEAIPVTNFTYNPANGNFSLTFGSTAGAEYQLEYSTGMAAGPGGTPDQWNISPVGSTIGLAGSTTLTGNVSSLQPANGGVLPAGSPRVFLRVRRL